MSIYINLVSGSSLTMKDGAIKTNSFTVIDGGSYATITHTETNRPSADFATTTNSSCTFNSSAPLSIPATPSYLDFDPRSYMYYTFLFTNPGSGSVAWVADGITTGMEGEPRRGVGYFYFYVSSSIINTIPPTIKPTSQEITYVSFWSYISTFMSKLTTSSRQMFENFWLGMYLIGSSMGKQATRFLSAMAPENAGTFIIDDYYEIQMGPLHSIPLDLDPTLESPNYNMLPISYALNIINITATDYYSVRDVGIGMYVVISVQSSSKWFKVANLLSSEEDPSGDRYIPANGFYDAPYTTKPIHRYQIELENADLTYIQTNVFSIYFTSAMAYTIKSDVLDVPYFSNYISGNGPKLIEGIDYTFINNIVEFNRDIVAEGYVNDEGYLYCREAYMIEKYLFSLYGSMVGIPDWTKYNLGPVSGKAAVNTLMNSLQDISDISQYNKALNVYYGIPVAPDKGVVKGLYESYGYTISEVFSYNNAVNLQTINDLTPMISKGARFYVENLGEFVVTKVIGNQVSFENITGLQVGCKMHLRLFNRYELKYTSGGSNPAIYMNNIYGNAYGSEAIQHVTNMIATSGVSPELIIYGSESNDGVYHSTGASVSTSPSAVQVNIYTVDTNLTEPIYNDFIPGTDAVVSTSRGYVHFPWPTHKFLLLQLSDGSVYRAYMDAPIDTILEDGDVVDKYAALSRSVLAMRADGFLGWNEYDQFKRYTGLDSSMGILQLTGVIPYAQYGKYFPSAYVEAV